MHGTCVTGVFPAAPYTVLGLSLSVHWLMLMGYLPMCHNQPRITCIVNIVFQKASREKNDLALEMTNCQNLMD